MSKKYTSSSNSNLVEQNRSKPALTSEDKAKAQKDRINSKKEQQIESMSNDQVVNELKEKRLPTFGTLQERKDRLKKHHGIPFSLTQGINGGVVPEQAAAPT